MKRKNKTKIKTIEDAIINKFPNVTIHEIIHTQFGTRVLGVVPAVDESDSDHIVEWDEHGIATECKANERDFQEIGWDEDEQKPVYVKTKMLLHNDRYNVNIHGSD